MRTCAAAMTPLVAVALVLAWVALAVPLALVIGAIAAARDRQVPEPAWATSPALGAARPSH